MPIPRSTYLAVLGALAAAAATSCARNPGPARPIPARADEPHLRNVRQLTFGGENAEAYFSYDGERLIFQSTHPGAHPCDQQYTMRTDGGDVRPISGGKGRTTCGYWFPGRRRLLYSSTFERDTACPPRPDMSKGYVWALYDYQIYTADADGGNLRRLTNTPGYNAEATLSPDGKTIVFTSVRGGDLDIYTMDADGGNVRQLTHELGYDGGPFFSPDGKRLVYRSDRKGNDLLQVFVADLAFDDQGNVTGLKAEHQLTDDNNVNWGPFWHPDGHHLIFATSRHGHQNYELYTIRDDGSHAARVTYCDGFDGLPVFSPDGKYVMWSAKRTKDNTTQLFIGRFSPPKDW